MARPRVLDEKKQREVCALITAGMSWVKVARYVGCSTKTLRREREENPEFDEGVRRAEMACSLQPMQALRHASRTSWRAAAWMVDREDRLEARRRAAVEKRRAAKQKACDKVSDAIDEARRIIKREVNCPFSRERIAAQLTNKFGAGSGVPMGPTPAEVDQSIHFLDQLYVDRAKAAGTFIDPNDDDDGAAGPFSVGESPAGCGGGPESGASAGAERPRHPRPWDDEAEDEEEIKASAAAPTLREEVAAMTESLERGDPFTPEKADAALDLLERVARAQPEVDLRAIYREHGLVRSRKPNGTKPDAPADPADAAEPAIPARNAPDAWPEAGGFVPGDRVCRFEDMAG